MHYTFIFTLATQHTHNKYDMIWHNETQEPYIYKTDLHINEVTLLTQLTYRLCWKSVNFFFFFKHLPQGHAVGVLYYILEFPSRIVHSATLHFFLTGLINFMKRWSDTDHIRGSVLIFSLIPVLLKSWALSRPQRKKRKTIKDSRRRPHLSAADLGNILTCIQSQSNAF